MPEQRRFIDNLQMRDRLRRTRAWMQRHPRATIGAAAGAGVAALVVVAVVVTGGRQTAIEPDASTASSSVSAEPRPSAPDADWAPITLPPYEPVANLLASAVEGSRVGTTTSFTLQSLTSMPAAELAERLTVEPAAELTVTAGDNVAEVTVAPRTPLLENAVYRFQLTDPTGALLDEWTFRTGGPLHVVRRLPDDASTQVPVDTGIEIEFDQDGVVGFAESFSMQPAVEGAFEQHGRTWAFIPTEPLAPATLYTVTLESGVHVDGVGEGLADDQTFAFETAPSAASADEPRVAMDRPLYEVRPGESAVIPVAVHGGFGTAENITRTARLFALGSAAAALDAAATLSDANSWAIWSSSGSVATDGLRLVGSYDAVIWTRWTEQRLELPGALERGFYLLDVEQPGRHAQLVLQVTDLAAYLLASDASVVAWVNDLGTEAPVAGASVSLADGTPLGQTDAAGLLTTTTPASLLSAPTVVDGFSTPDPAFVVVGAPDGSEAIAVIGADPSWFFGQQSPSEAWWMLLATDRLQYRSDDTIHAWGYVRARSDRSVPENVELRLLAGWGPYAPPIERRTITPTSRGTIFGDLPVDDLPPGQYNVALFVGDEVVAQSSISVTEIRKPSFRVDLDTSRHAYIQGETVSASVAATFFDGTTVPGLELMLDASTLQPAGQQRIKLGRGGTASLTFEAQTTSTSVESGMLHVAPVSPEEGQSYADESFAVFPSTAWLKADATLENGTLTVSGSVSRVDLAAAEAQLIDGWVRDPSGQGLAGRAVTAAVDRITWKAVQNGTSYDFIEKRAVPTYDYQRQVERVGSFPMISGADGSFQLQIPFDDADAGAEITLSAADEDGRSVELSTWASNVPAPSGGAADFPYLEHRGVCGPSAGQITADLDETYDVMVRSGDGAPDADGRTLFAVGRAGIDDVIITTGAGIERLFGDGDLPSVTVRAVRFTPAGYIEMNDVVVRVNPDDKTIELSLEADADRYGPGDEVSIAVRTTDADGQPIATDVVLQAVDAKLYAIGAATAMDASPLMLPASSAFIGSYATHLVPTPDFGDGCGAATGGGEEPRTDFKDNATFQLVQTAADGRGTVRFDAPDDLTSWVVSAAAFSGALDSGTASIEVPVGLPFFVDAVVAPEYLAGEEPIIHLSTYGDELDAADSVTFTVEAPSLGLDETIEAEAFEGARIRLPSLTLGDHELTVRAEGPADLTDAVVRTVRVVPTRLRTLQTAYATVRDGFDAPGGDGMTTYAISDGGRGALVPVLQQLAWSTSARLDATLAAELARQLLIGEFGLPDASVPASGWAGIGAQPPEGLALMPYASGDLFLTARAALVAPDHLPVDFIAATVTTALDEDASRERSIVALAALAGIDRDVLSQLRAFDPGELTVREQLWLALGLTAAGDDDAARAIERAILTEHGQRLGGWVRLDAGVGTPEGAEATASMLLLAAELRDPIAIDISRYLLDNPSRLYLPALEQIGYVRSAMEWLPRAAARFVWTVDGERHEESLEAGGAMSLSLTAAQRESFELQALEGELFVASSWLGEARYDELASDESVTIQRSVSPSDHAPADDLVHVTLKVHFDGPLASTCYQVTDLLPSGLAPVAQTTWAGMDPELVLPYEVEGQRVSWCIGTDRADVSLGYSARVVSAGTYRWEPAVIQAVAAPEVGSATAVITYTID